MNENTQAIYFIKYTQLLEEVSEILKKLDVISQEQGFDIFNPEYGLKDHYLNIQEMKKNNHKYIPKKNDDNIQTEPLFLKLIDNKHYSETIKSNIYNTVEKFIHAKDTNERAQIREQLVFQWAQKIVDVSGHNGIKSGKNLLNGKSDLDASVILAIEDILPIDRHDILGERDSTEYAVLEQLRKQMTKNIELKKSIDKVGRALLRLLDEIDDRNFSDIADYIIPSLEKGLKNLKETK